MDGPKVPEPGRSGTNPNYTQVNILFPSSEVELPPADKYKAFPPEAQKAILLGFRSEQLQRHEWLKRQQDHDHQLNIRAQLFAFIRTAIGTVGAIFIVLTMVIGGTVLLNSGATAYGVFLIFLAISGVIGTAIYGHRAMKVFPAATKPPHDHPVQTTPKLEE